MAPSATFMSDSGNSLQILVVEDHADTRHLMERFLRASGHTVTAADSFRAGAAALGSQTFDVLVSDIGLPDGRGWDLLAEGKTPPNLYAVAMSGFGTSPDRARSAAAGFRHHLLKPINLDQLEAILTEASAERRARGISSAPEPE